MDNGGIGWIRSQLGQESSEGDAAPRLRGTSSDGLGSFVGEGAQFEGTLRIRGALRIDGEFRGAIESQAAVIVGAEAGIEATVHAREIVIRGAVVGDVTATRELTLLSGGRLHGDVETPSLQIEKGAFFNGRTAMARPEATAQEQPAKAAPSAPQPSAPAGA